MVQSVDDLNHSCCVRGIRMPDFEVLDARIPSALNKIIQNSYFKKKVSLEEQNDQKEDRFLRGRQDRLRDLCTAESLVFMIPLLITLIFLNHSSQRGCSGIRYEMG